MACIRVGRILDRESRLCRDFGLFCPSPEISEFLESMQESLGFSSGRGGGVGFLGRDSKAATNDYGAPTSSNKTAYCSIFETFQNIWDFESSLESARLPRDFRMRLISWRCSILGMSSLSWYHGTFVNWKNLWRTRVVSRVWVKILKNSHLPPLRKFSRAFLKFSESSIIEPSGNEFRSRAIDLTQYCFRVQFMR